MAENTITEVGDHGNLQLSMPASTQSKPCCDSHSHEHGDVKVPSIFDAVKSGFVVVTNCNVIEVCPYFAECGKLSRGNLRKIKCGTFRKVPVIAFPDSAAEKFRISADRKTTVCSHCTTDVQPSRSPLLPYSLSFVCQRTVVFLGHVDWEQWRNVLQCIPGTV